MRIFLTFVFCAVLTACSNSDRVYTVEELIADEALRTELIGKCRNNPGELGQTPNCQNAEAADFKARLARMRKSLGG
ncbi:EexN family lipoprotein [Ensifer sp. IC4062]|nr:EexN family lipoprotein [Ensifer sp. IC4062]MCA1439370.1 EexN family lipoprotein [Ensifer sp. IC4062]